MLRRPSGYSLTVESSRGHIRVVPGSEQSSGGAGDPPRPSADLTPFVSALREASEHENRKEELAGEKTRSAITIAGAYFAVVQTATFASSGTLGALEGWGKTWTIALAVGAVLALGAAICSAVIQQWPREHKALNSFEIAEDLTELLNGERTNDQATYDLANRYWEVTDSRQKANSQRLRLYYLTAAFSTFAVALTTVEIAVSLLSRI